MELLSLERVLIDGGMAVGAFTVLVMGSLAYNARLWMHDYPEEIRVLQAPLDRSEKREQILLAVVFFTMLFGGLFLSAQGLEAANGGAISFGAAFVHVYLIWSIVNLWDAVVLDWFVITVLKPSFVFLPGSETRMHVYRDWSMHVTNFFKGVVIGAVMSAIIAGVAVVV